MGVTNYIKKNDFIPPGSQEQLLTNMFALRMIPHGINDINGYLASDPSVSGAMWSALGKDLTLGAICFRLHKS